MDLTYQSKSFGLLDDNLLNDLTLNNPNKSNNEAAVKQKPPIPNGTKKKSMSESTQPLMNDLVFNQNCDDQAEETQVSIRLNDSDFKQLGVDEFTFDNDEDEQDENDRTLDNNQQKLIANNNVFDTLLGQNRGGGSNEMLLNETSDILRNSNEFSQTNIINYDAMDAINDATSNNATTTTITVNDDQNYTINEADTSAAAKINALVMQSVERFKRCVNVGSPINLDCNSLVNPFSNNKEKNDDRRFSVSTVKTQSSNMNCDEMNNVTQNQTISYELSNQIDGSTPLRQINNQSSNDESAVQSMSIYFKPDKNVKQEDFVENNDDTTYKQQQQQFTSASFIFDKDNQENGPDLSMFATNGGSSNKLSDFNIFGNGQLNSKDMNLTDSDFKPGNECLSELINAEKQNRKEFTNELSVLATSSSDESKITNEEDINTTTTESKVVRDKWWKSQETTSNNLEQTKTQEYFISNSSFPTFLANKDPEMNYSMLHKTEQQQQQEQNQPEKEQEQDVTISEEKLKLVSDAVVDFSLSATKNHASSNGSASFSFTLNTSETGDCLIFKKNNSDSKSAETTTTPFQAARSVNLYQQKKQQQQATTVTNSNLKTIGEELDRVSNRLAEQMNDTVSTTTITAIATTTTFSNDKPTTSLSRSNHHQKNNQLIMTMDETISSINSSSNRTTNLVKKQFHNHHHKQQKAASSLTSTPSKLNKKSEKSIKKDEMTTTSNFLAQESFMSSIPESKTNDSTLVGNHHQYFLTNGNKKIINNIKNVEIQTSPDKSTSSSTSTPTTSFSSSTTAVDQVVTKHSQEINQTPSQPTSSVITTSQMVANLAASLLAAGSNSSSSNNNVNETNSNRTSLFNSSNNNNAGLIPVAFMPIDAVFPYVQKMYDNFQQRSQIDMSTHSIGNSGAGGITNPQRQSSGGLFSSSSLSSDYSAVSTSSSSNNKYKYEMPQLEIDKKSIDFGQIAEGCHETCRLFAKLTNTNLIQQHREHSIMSNLEIEMDKDILIERVNQQTKCLNKLDDINVVPIISKTIGIHLDKQEFFNLKQNLKLEFVTNYYEFYVHLNTIDLDYFQQQTGSLCNNGNSDEQYNCLEPLAVKTNLSIYYCYVENNCQRKFLLNQIEIKFVLGYARLRSSDLNYINQIEFDLLSIMNRSSRTNYIDHDDNDKTLNSNHSCSSISSSSSTSLENSIQLSNGGNIPINVDCYLIDKNEIINNNQDNTKMKLIYLKNRQFQLKIDKSIINLEAKTNANYKKQLARLILTRINDLNTTMTSFDDLNIHLIFQVMPNGFKYEIPIKLIMNTTTATTTNNNKNLKKMQSLDTITKIFSSKSILFFGKTLANNVKSSLLSEAGLINEFIIKNMNDYKLKYDISVSTCLNESASTTSMYDECIDMSSNSTISSASISKAIVNLFKFTPDMKEKSLKEDSSLTRLIIELEPGQEITIRIKFNSSLVESDKNNQLSNVFGIVQLKTFNQQRSNIYLVGFLNRSQLCIDTNENKLVKITDLQNDHYSKLTRQICNKNLQLFSHEYQLMPTWTDEISCNFSFRKSIQLQNKSFTNSKITVYLVMYDCKENCELENLQPFDENIIYDLDACLINGFKSRFKLRLEKNKLNRLNNTLWFELSPNETDSIQIDFEFKLNKAGSINRKKLIDYFEKNEKKIDQFNISLFWIESEINCQCLNGAQQFKNNNNSSILLEDKFIESFLKRLLTNNAISSSNGLFINSIITKKARLQFDTMVSLMSQALKCSNLKLSFLIKLINNNKQYEQNSFNFTNNSFLVTNDQNQVSLLNEISNLSLNTSNKDETWSILNDSIVIKNVKFDSASTCFTSKITIKNHLANKELVFNIAFNSACLDVQPGRGKISPLQTLDVIVRVRRAIANKSGIINGNSWHGIISVICNKIEKDVKVSIYGPSSIASTSSSNNSNNSINNSSMLSQSSRQSTSRLSSTSKLLKAPIQSSTLPVPSVTNKRVSTLENIATASTSSLSIADSYLEQGTLLSEPSLDSFSLTPFMNASFQMTASQSTTQRLVSKSVNDDTIIKVLHHNNNAHIKFPSVCTSKSKSYDFTLINPTNSFVSWKAQTPKSINLQNLTRSTSYSVFKLMPSTGVIQANQKQIIKIEFCPREETGDFQEIWEIETKTSSPTSYSCKLIISGKSISTNDQDKFNNILSDYNAQQRTNKSISNLSKFKLKDAKENNDPFSCSSNNKTSEYDQTIESSNKSNADFDYSLINTRKIIIKTEIIEFTDTCVGAKAKSFILIDNKEEKKCSLSIISLIEPFYCKHPSIDIQPKHYIRVPIEFKPLTKGEYRDKVLIRIEGNEMPLSCVVKGKCV